MELQDTFFVDRNPELDNISKTLLSMTARPSYIGNKKFIDWGLRKHV